MVIIIHVFRYNKGINKVQANNWNDVCMTKHWQGIIWIHPQPVSIDMAIKMEDILMALDEANLRYSLHELTQEPVILFPTENIRTRIDGRYYCGYPLTEDGEYIKFFVPAAYHIPLDESAYAVLKVLRYSLASQTARFRSRPRRWRSASHDRLPDWRWYTHNRTSPPLL